MITDRPSTSGSSGSSGSASDADTEENDLVDEEIEGSNEHSEEEEQGEGEEVGEDDDIGQAEGAHDHHAPDTDEPAGDQSSGTDSSDSDYQPPPSEPSSPSNSDDYTGESGTSSSGESGEEGGSSADDGEDFQPMQDHPMPENAHENLYEGAPLTRIQSYLMIHQHLNQFHPSRVEKESLLRLINAHCPAQNSCFQGIGEYENFLNNGEGYSSIHEYCGVCHYLYVNNDEDHCPDCMAYRWLGGKTLSSRGCWSEVSGSSIIK